MLSFDSIIRKWRKEEDPSSAEPEHIKKVLKSLTNFEGKVRNDFFEAMDLLRTRIKPDEYIDFLRSIPYAKRKTLLEAAGFKNWFSGKLIFLMDERGQLSSESKNFFAIEKILAEDLRYAKFFPEANELIEKVKEKPKIIDKDPQYAKLFSKREDFTEKVKKKARKPRVTFESIIKKWNEDPSSAEPEHITKILKFLKDFKEGVRNDFFEAMDLLRTRIKPDEYINFLRSIPSTKRKNLLDTAGFFNWFSGKLISLMDERGQLNSELQNLFIIKKILNEDTRYAKFFPEFPKEKGNQESWDSTGNAQFPF